MRATAPPLRDRDHSVLPLSRRQVAFDVLLAAACLTLTLIINLGGSESVAANRNPDALTIALTVVSVGSIALRRKSPLATLALTLVGVFGLILVKGTVGLAPIGPYIAAYTAVALGTPRRSRLVVGVVALSLVLVWLLDPVDLSREGALMNAALFAGVLLFGTSTRARRERFDADVVAAEQSIELERERAESDRERAAREMTQERLRITRELHDVLGHAMIVMVVQAGVAGRFLDTEDTASARAAVAEIEQAGRRSMADIRNLLGVLRDGEPEGEGSPRAPVPTLNDVAALAIRVGEAGLRTTLTVHGTRSALNPGVDLAAYRVVQEALTNCLKHSGAASATVEVTYRPHAVEVQVADDGHGPEAGPPGQVDGHGLAGMRERVAVYGGDLAVGARPEGGFWVRATFPLEMPS